MGSKRVTIMLALKERRSPGAQQQQSCTLCHYCKFQAITGLHWESLLLSKSSQNKWCNANIYHQSGWRMRKKTIAYLPMKLTHRLKFPQLLATWGTADITVRHHVLYFSKESRACMLTAQKSLPLLCANLCNYGKRNLSGPCNLERKKLGCLIKPFWAESSSLQFAFEAIH